MLKKLRVLFAVVMGVVITFYFLDFAGLTTGWPNLARIQFVPALLAGGFGILLILSLLNLSEPTRLLGLSYAVFCFEKKKKNTHVS